jgi:glycosyltransferase involved in cell wall biosynthesis
LFLHHSGNLGGAEFSLFDLVDEVRRRGEQVTIALPDRGSLYERFRQNGIHVVLSPVRPVRIRSAPWSIGPFPFRWIRATRQLAGLVRRAEISIIHANSVHACLYGTAVSRLTGRPLVWHERDLSHRPWQYRFLGRFASRIIAISDCVAENLRHHGIPPEKVVTIRNGIRTDLFSGKNSKSRRDLILPENAPLVLMTAQFVPWKRHEDFIDAAAIIVQTRPETRFVLAGAPTDRAHVRRFSVLMKQIAERNLAQSFIVPGFITDMPSLLANCDCLAHPAVGEPFGRIVAEAMAAGKPIVAVNDSGPAELIRHNIDGLLVPPRSPDSLAASVLRILEDPGLGERLGSSAKQRVVAEFSMERVATQFFDVLTSLEDTEKRIGNGP